MTDFSNDSPVNLTRKARVRRCVRLSPLLMVYLPSAMFAVSIILLTAHLYVGLLFAFAIPVFLTAGFVVAAVGTARLRCWHCGDRFLSIAFPVWPFQGECTHCCTAVNEPE